jgi:hypothetical protein
MARRCTRCTYVAPYIAMGVAASIIMKIDRTVSGKA